MRNEEQRQSRKPYRVEIDVKGCDHCSGGRMWTIVGPDEVAIGSSWGDEEFINDIADLMNMAYQAGREALPDPE